MIHNVDINNHKTKSHRVIKWNTKSDKSMRHVIVMKWKIDGEISKEKTIIRGIYPN